VAIAGTDEGRVALLSRISAGRRKIIYAAKREMSLPV